MPSSRPLWAVWDSVSKTKKEESRDVREPNSQVSYQGVWAEVRSQEGGERVHELESWSTREEEVKKFAFGEAGVKRKQSRSLLPKHLPVLSQ